MAELILKVGDGANYSDGDILCAMNRRMIRCCHAQMLCHVKNAGFNSDGLRPLGALAQDYREACCELRFERISFHEMDKVEIATGNRTRITGPEFDVTIGALPVHHVSWPEIRNHRTYGRMTRSQTAVLIAALEGGLQAVEWDGPILNVAGVPTPFTAVNTNPEFTEVDLHLRRRQKHERHALFGTRGAEVWYGGRTDHSHAALDNVWNAIQTKTPRRETEAEFQLWPMGRLDIRSHLAVRWREFDDEQAATLTEPEYERDRNGDIIADADGNRIVVGKRFRRIDWRTTLLGDIGATEAQVDDRDFPVGHEITELGRTRYTSKTQPEQTDDTRIRTRTTEPVR